MEAFVVSIEKHRSLVAVLFTMIFLAGCTMRAPISGFEPTEPAQAFDPNSRRLAIPTVYSNRPTLVWKPFPGTHEAYGFSPKSKFVEVDLTKVSEITYQIRIWDTENGFPTTIVYDRRNLPGTSHQVGEPLEFGKIYFWSIRSEFSYEGERRLTEWSITSLPHHGATARRVARTKGFIPPSNYFRFRTPTIGSVRIRKENLFKPTKVDASTRDADASRILSSWKQRSDILRKAIAKTHPEIFDGPWHITAFEIEGATLVDQDNRLVRLATRYSIAPREGVGGPPKPRTYRRNVVVDDSREEVVEIGERAQVN
jgi:hypothetical protein